MMIKRWKGGIIKSRLCLQDVAYSKALGGELFAATPSLMALRTGLTIASGWCNSEKDIVIGVVAGDVTQAFVHADMDEKIIKRTPKDLGNMKVNIGGKETTPAEGDWLQVIKSSLADALL